MKIFYFDFQLNYPAQSRKVKRSTMLGSVELANQLCLLHDIESKKSNISDYLSQWLVTVLGDRSSAMAKESEFPTITKKVRDEVLDTFQRSGYWMTLKVLLQLNLTIEFGRSDGRLVYKLLILNILTQICDSYNRSEYELLNIDLMNQMLAKLARRIEKLLENGRPMETSDSSIDLSMLYTHAIDQAKLVVAKTRNKIDRQIDKLIEKDVRHSHLAPMMNFDFQADVVQKVPTLIAYIARRSNKFERQRYDGKLRTKHFQRHHLTKKCDPGFEIFDKLHDEIGSNLYLSDYENWFLYEFTVSDGVAYDAIDLRQMFFHYSSTAGPFYKDDPIGSSKMTLQHLKFVTILDMIATRDYPLLAHHRTGIDPDIFDQLLLPQHVDMQIALELQTYLKNRNANASLPALIEEDNPSAQSFGVKYAEANFDMQSILLAVEAKATLEIETKRTLWTSKRSEVETMRKRTEGMTCDYYTNHRKGFTAHDRNCGLCKLRKQIKQVKMPKFVRPLPNDIHLQNAVVFELRIPIQIAGLRDVLYEVIRLFGKQQPTYGSYGRDELWVDHAPISTYNQSNCERVKLTRSSSYNYGDIHVDHPFESFILQNDCNCRYNSSRNPLPKNMDRQSVKELCTFKVESGSPYTNLQWTLNGTTHTQNEVLAKQSTCPTTLLLSEYKNFGSLRADGHRLQLLKLYGMIETEALSFETPSVLALLMQTLWQAGPMGECNRTHRESHENFADIPFVLEMLKLLHKFVQQQENNWKHPLKLLVAALIAVRMFELNADESVADKIVQLLRQLRTVAIDWIRKIQANIQESNKQNSSDISLRDQLVDVSIAGAVTFFVHFRHQFFGKIFFATNGMSAVRMWLEFIVTLNNNHLLNGNSNDTPVTTRHSLFLRLVRNIGICVEWNVMEMIEARPVDVFDFIKARWSRANDGTFGDLEFIEDQSQVIVPITIDDERNDVFIDVITGEFEVNNQPVAKLSLAIAKTAVFERVFQQFAFEVQPGEPNCFSTLQNYRNCSYMFSTNPNTDEIAVTERRMNGTDVYELLPHYIMAKEIPYLLVEKYSHWWNTTTNIIEFRPKLFSDDRFVSPAGVEYELNLNTRRLIHLKTKRLMLDVNSWSYRSITEQLSRLECKKYIHVLMDTSNGKVARVELMRMHLKFEIDTSMANASGGYDMASNEFNGMRISLQQKNGTLFGLNHGLYLESIQGKGESLLILPHGAISFSTTNHHATVNIDVNGELNNPPFHVYCVDGFLQQITSKNSCYSAWFYLSYLHALTTHGTPETFTGLTGTERSMQILQSGFIWSSPSAPYDPESIQLLQLIAQLSPVRTIKKVQWPKDIPTHAAHDSFVLIVTKLLADGQRLRETKEKRTRLRTTDELSLNRRDYLRWLQLYPNLSVSDTFTKHETLTTKEVYFADEGPPKNVRITSILYHEDSFHVANDFDLKTFLIMGTGRLDGLAHTDHIDTILTHNNSLTLTNLWISLYETARQQVTSREKFALVFSLLAHQGGDLKAILALQTVARNSGIFSAVNPPGVMQYNVQDLSYSADFITRILQSHHSNSSEYRREFTSDQRQAYNRQIQDNIRVIADDINAKRHCDAVCSSDYRSYAKDIRIDTAIEQINSRLLSWNNNTKLLRFIDEVEEKFKSLRCDNADINVVEDWSKNASHFHPPATKPKFSIDFESKLCEQVTGHASEVEEAKYIYNNRIVDDPERTSRSADEWWDIFTTITQSHHAKHLIDAQMYPRPVKSLVLPRLLPSQRNENIKSIIGAFAVTLTHEQRDRRISMFEQQPQMLVALEREQETQPHSNWRPCEHPEWILFEIEQNISIRPIQIKIAQRMMDPPNTITKHSVMQLNMGEGKTAVIVPILASVLSDGVKVCQITVLKSLYATNLKSLRKYLGGMLNRRVYTFPCRRDMAISCYIQEMMHIYAECKRQKGKENNIAIQTEVTKQLPCRRWVNEFD